MDHKFNQYWDCSTFDRFIVENTYHVENIAIDKVLSIFSILLLYYIQMLLWFFPIAIIKTYCSGLPQGIIILNYISSGMSTYFPLVTTHLQLVIRIDPLLLTMQWLCARIPIGCLYFLHLLIWRPVLIHSRLPAPSCPL